MRGVTSAGIVFVQMRYRSRRRRAARVASIARSAGIHPASSPVSQWTWSWQHGRTATRARAPMARSRAASVSRPQPWQDTMRSLAVADTSIDAARDEGHAARQPRPEGHEHLMQTPVRGRQCRIDDERARRGVVEQQHDVREQPVATAEVDDTAAAAHPPHAPRHLPRFVQLLARQALGRTDRPGDSIEQRLAAEAPEVVRGEAAVRAARERRSRMSHGAGVILPCPAGPGEARCDG